MSEAVSEHKTLLSKQQDGVPETARPSPRGRCTTPPLVQVALELGGPPSRPLLHSATVILLLRPCWAHTTSYIFLTTVLQSYNEFKQRNQIKAT